MKFNSIRFKISVLYVVVLGIILIIFSTFLYFSLYYFLHDELDNELKLKAEEVARTIDSYLIAMGSDQKTLMFVVKRVVDLEGEHPDQKKISELEYQWLQKVDKMDLKEDYINFWNTQGELLFGSKNLQKGTAVLSPKEIKKIKAGNDTLKNIKFDNRSLRAISIPFSDSSGSQYIIQVATSLKPIINLLQVRLLHIIVGIVIVLVIASFFGQIFAVRILRPVKEITKTAQNITHEDLTARVKTEHVDEEMRYLVDAFNDMIARLERSFKYIAEFSSYVAHELKTPLAIIRGEAELALRKKQDTSEYKRVIKVNLEEVERMLKIVEDLLLLSRLDYRPEVFKFEQFDLSNFLNEVYESSKILASEKGIAVDVSMPEEKATINADKTHLRRLFFNLINNSIKFTSDRGRINIIVKYEKGNAVISIADTGSGIKVEDLPKIFDKFFHKSDSAQNIQTGIGLGLSIAQSIAKMHQGAIEVQSVYGKGSTFTVILPLT